MGDNTETRALTPQELKEKFDREAMEQATREVEDMLAKFRQGKHLAMADEANVPRDLHRFMDKQVEILEANKGSLISDYAKLSGAHDPGVDGEPLRYDGNQIEAKKKRLALRYQDKAKDELLNWAKDKNLSVDDAYAANNAMVAHAPSSSGFGGLVDGAKGLVYDDKKESFKWPAIIAGAVGAWLGGKIFGGESFMGILGMVLGAIGLAWVGSKFTFDHTLGNTNDKDKKNEKGQQRTLSAGETPKIEQSEGVTVADAGDKYNMVQRMGQIAKENGYVSPLAKPAVHQSNERLPPERTPPQDKPILWAGLDGRT